MMQNTEVRAYFLFIALIFGKEHKTFMWPYLKRTRKGDKNMCIFIEQKFYELDLKRNAQK